MTVQEFNRMLDEVSINFYESGAYYDSDLGDWALEKQQEIEETYNVSLIEGL